MVNMVRTGVLALLMACAATPPRLGEGAASSPLLFSAAAADAPREGELPHCTYSCTVHLVRRHFVEQSGDCDHATRQ
eukprot:7387035-Prymnesium_polylepis.1